MFQGEQIVQSKENMYKLLNLKYSEDKRNIKISSFQLGFQHKAERLGRKKNIRCVSPMAQ